MAKLTLSDIASGYGSTTKINANNDAVVTAIENTLSRDGTSPNEMEADLDMNSYRILNLPTAVSNSEPVTLAQAGSIAGVENPLTRESVGAVFYPRTAQEVTAAVTPTNYYYEPGDVRRYGAEGDGVADDSTAIQTAINSGHTVLFPVGTYLAGNLTQSTDYQRLVGQGRVRIVKNANGPLITASGDYIEFNGITFAGDAASPTYTGDNVVASGEAPRFLNCGSMWAYGRALKATGNAVQIFGSNGIWQTADATASGWDIEIGVANTATLYHQLHGVYSSQSTGGLLFIDTGSQTIVGGQFGKLKLDSDGAPGGSGGGMISGCRITGAVTIELPSCLITNCQFADNITFAATTSGCSYVGNIQANGKTITNNGNANNLIIRDTGTGSNGINVKFGQDSSLGVLTIDPTDGKFTLPGTVVVNNNKAQQFLDSAGTSYGFVLMTSGNLMQLGNANGSINLSSSTGKYIFSSLPTSASGLTTGMIWNDSGTVKVIS